MNKKLLALAVTSALAGVSAGVNADTANVTVYGKLFPEFQTDSGHGATAAGSISSSLANAAGADVVSHQEVSVGNSNIGFKGEDSLGGGMKGWFQVEQDMKLDVGTGQWANRNSAVGLAGGFGNVFLGNWDTVYKQLGDPVGFLDGLNLSLQVLSANVLSRPAFSTGVSGTDLSSFHVRQKNDIEYDSPKFGGFTVMLNYSPDEAKTLNKDAYLRDIGVKFEQGPLYVALANELHKDFFGASSTLPGTIANPAPSATNGLHSKDTATRLSAKYTLPSNTTLGIDVAQMEYKEDNGAVNHFESYKHKAVSLVAQQQMGNLGFAASLVKAEKGTCSLAGGANCDTSGMDGQMLNLGVRYNFSKRTGVFALYSKITNKDSAQFNNIGSSVTTISPGADPEAFGVGIITSF